MKKANSKHELKKGENSPDSPKENEIPVTGGKDENSIQEFIETRKLQNRILEKIIENINHNDKKFKSKNKQK